MTTERDEIMDRMNGQWKDYIGRAIGVEYVTGKHSGCPWCGGKDRFRVFDDFNETGGCICNQCGKFANGIDTLIQIRKTDFKAVISELRKHLGMERKAKAKNRGKESIPTQLAKWDNVIGSFMRHNAGCTETGLRRAGAVLGNTDGGDLVFAVPCCNSKWEQVDSSVLLSAQFKHLLTSKGEQVRHRTMFGHKYGELLLCSKPDFSKAKIVFRVEGVTSYIALLSVIPEDVWESGQVVVFSNPAGAGQVPSWAPKAIAESVRGCDIFVLGDSDEVGLKSMREWAERIAQCNFTNQVRAVPFGENGNADLRDWLNERNVLDLAEEFAGLVSHCRAGELIEPDKDKPEGESTREVDKALELLERYGVRVIGQDETHLHVWSNALEKVTKFANSRPRIPDIQLIGAIGTSVYSLESKEYKELCKAMFLIGGMHPIVDPRPPGIWGDVITQEASLYVLGDDGKLKLQPSMSHDGYSYAVRTGKWFSPDVTNVELGKPDDYFRAQFHRLEDMIDTFTWADNRVAVDLMPGLMLASMNASCFHYRPYVYLTAPSNAGKTTFGQLFFDQYKRCVLANSQMFGISTRAAVRLIASQSQGPIFLDEFDNNRHAKSIIEMARQSSRNQVEIISLRMGQEGMLSRLQQIFWFCGIHSVDSSEADDNRMLRFEMRPGRMSVGEFLDRQLGELERLELREAITAMALIYVPVAAKLINAVYRRLTDAAGDQLGQHKRVLESLAVPIAVRAAVMGVDPAEEQDSFYADQVSDYLTSIGGMGAGTNLESESDSLLEELAGREVRMGGSVRTVASILASQARSIAEGSETQRDGSSELDSYQVTHPDAKWFDQLWEQFGLCVSQPRKPHIGTPEATPVEDQKIVLRWVRKLATILSVPQGKITAVLKSIPGAVSVGCFERDHRFSGWKWPLKVMIEPNDHQIE